ncbi:hypothetical protein BCR37DRAFT_388958 [Protomyces lactucae-debilis]|uniref:E3 ubiquitin-protein ligase listerin n=1 Tax=Protomyces lactucae-debilis TaxID=2754530 RepID=A0A1Y2F3H1_PROLT|nr:uncharacterized protein BCR37DRAFT_388958 [Protomyces lactucae-debilis]ORY78237.1 hypothetical protein BCR37DRAFT_388958 [Protomyces lactucae-debilis]
MVSSGSSTPQRPFGGFQFGAQLTSSPTIGADLSPRAAVIFKGLNKRDSTTRAKAADELIEYLGSADYNEDESEALIANWVSVYQSLALDIDRRVRSSAHTVTGKLVLKYGRKTARFMKSDISGLWMLGQYDGDRPVARAATDAFEAAFASAEKRTNFTKVFASSIWHKAYELAFEETADSLSDARFTKPAEADAKYDNTAASAMAVMTRLISASAVETDVLHTLLADASIWTVSLKSSAVQRSALTLIKAALDATKRSDAESEACSKQISKMLPKVEVGNSIAALALLECLRSSSAQSLFMAGISKGTLAQRLPLFIERITGSGVPDSYWAKLQVLLEAEHASLEENTALRQSLRIALSKAASGATRMQAEQAALAYAFMIVEFQEDQVDEEIISIITRLVDQGQLKSDDAWARHLKKIAEPARCDAFIAITTSILKSTAKLSAAQQRSVKSWFHVIHASTEWLDTTRLAQELATPAASAIQKFDDAPDSRLLVLTELFTVLPALKQGPIADDLDELLRVLNLSGSINGSQLLRVAHSDDTAYIQSVQLTLTKMGSDQDRKIAWLMPLFDTNQAAVGPVLAETLQQTRPSVNGTNLQRFMEATRLLVEHKFVVSAELCEVVMQVWLHAIKSDLMLVAEAMEHFAAHGLVQPLQLAWSSKDFLSSLFLQEEEHDGTSKRILSCISQVVEKEQLAQTFRDCFLDAHSTIPIRALLQAFSTLSLTWTDLDLDNELEHALEEAAPSAFPDEMLILGPTSPARQFTRGSDQTSQLNLVEGFNAAYRLGLLLDKSNQNLDATQSELLATWTEMVEDGALHPQANHMYNDHAQLTLLQDHDALRSPDNISNRIQASRGSRPMNFYKANLLYKELCRLREQGISTEDAERVYIECSEGDDSFLPVFACSVALNEVLFKSQKASYARNKLASDLTRDAQSPEALRQMWLLYALLPEPSEVSGPLLPRQRAVFLLQALLKANVDDALHTYARLTLLLRFFEELKTEYGSFWVLAVELVQHSLQKAQDGSVPLQYAASKAYSWLKSNSESNDDLSEAYQYAKKDLEFCVAKLFVAILETHLQGQASTLVTLLVARLARGVSNAVLQSEDVSSRMPVALLSPFVHIQLTAAHIQAAALVSERDSMILATTLTKEYEQLDVGVSPALLSIVLDSPVMDEEGVDVIPDPLPTNLRGYLLAWKCLYGYFENVPLRMKVKLVKDLEDADVLEPLLALIFVALGVDTPKPKDISKIEKLTLDHGFNNGQGELQAYAAHLYCLCLIHTPNLVRSWWIACKDRVLTANIETFTEKYYSNLLIQSELASVHSDNIRKAIQDDNLEVRLSNLGRDVIVEYTVDDQTMQMAIKLPANFPLRKVTVEGLQKIGVKDAQWRGWLLSSQAVLTAHNGTILDAIVQFQKNVSLHFEGIEDCSICFSVLAVEDRSLPTKRCATCKHLFHGSCLYKWFKSSAQATCALCRSSFYSTD